jgi:hypothetical protein
LNQIGRNVSLISALFMCFPPGRELGPNEVQGHGFGEAFELAMRVNSYLDYEHHLIVGDDEDGVTYRVSVRAQFPRCLVLLAGFAASSESSRNCRMHFVKTSLSSEKC